jgi:5-formyltetrahydrofolate cyclo-ligase
MAENQDDILDRKRRVRRQVAEVLARLSADRRRAASLAAAARVADLPFIQAARTVMAFLSLPTEIETWPIIQAAWRRGQRIVVPRIDQPARPPQVRVPGPGSRMGRASRREIVAVVLEASDVASAALHPAVRPGPMGILEVPGAPPAPAGEIDVVLAPCQAVDRRGRRLGKGGGFYDRFLGRPDLVARVAALALQEQLVEAVPTAAWDRPVEVVVTDAETIWVVKGP